MKTAAAIIRILAAIMLASSFFSCSKAQEAEGAEQLENKLAGWFKNAEKAVKKGDIRECDFWIARYLGVTESYGEMTQRNYFDLVPVFQARKDLQNPSAIISGGYDKGFVLFFFGASRLMWNVPEENVHSSKYVALRSNTDESYVAQFIAYPEVRTWTSVIRGEQKIIASPMGSAVKKPYIRAGKLTPEKKIRYMEPYYLELEPHQAVQYVWHIEFHDITYDGIPEIWVRYNIASRTGFTQVLSIFKIEDDARLRPYRKYAGHPDGLALRLENGDIITGRGFSKKGKPQMEFESYRIETWKFDGEDYVKQEKTKEMKNILLSDEWKKYYF